MESVERIWVAPSQISCHNESCEVRLPTRKAAQPLIRVLAFLYAPYAFLDARGNPDGFEVRLVQDICRGLGFRCRIDFTAPIFPDIFQKMRNESYDLLIPVVHSNIYDDPTGDLNSSYTFCARPKAGPRWRRVEQREGEVGGCEGLLRGGGR